MEVSIKVHGIDGDYFYDASVSPDTYQLRYAENAPGLIAPLYKSGISFGSIAEMEEVARVMTAAVKAYKNINGS